MEQAQRQIGVSYPKQQRGGKLYATGGGNNVLPFKINMVGVMPPILAQTLIIFPVGIMDMLSRSYQLDWLGHIALFMQHGELLYMVMFVMMVVLFAFYLTAMMFSPDEISSVLKKRGAVIPGVRPGQYTAKYIDSVITHLTLFGGLYLAFVSVMPDIVVKILHMNLLFGGTSLLIMVVVVIEFMSQVQSYLIPGQYEMMSAKSGQKLSLLR